MGSFFERNKRKGPLALLLLLFKRGKGLGVLLLLALMVSGLFTVPSRLVWGIPGLVTAMRALGLGSFVEDPDVLTLARLEETLRSARYLSSHYLSSRSELEQLARTAARLGNYDPTRSSVAMVRGGWMAELMRCGRRGSVGDGRGGNCGMALGGAGVGGILRPEDAEGRKRPEGAPVGEDTLRSLLASAAAGMPGGGEAGGFAGLYGFSSGGKGVGLGGASGPASQGGLVAAAFGGVRPPAVGSGKPVGLGSAGGKLSKYKWSALRSRIGNSFGAVGTSDGKSASYKLAEAKAFSALATSPSCQGTCPQEYASHAIDVPFVNGETGGIGILTADSFDSGVTLTPGADELNQELLGEIAGDAARQACYDAIEAGNAARNQMVPTWRAGCVAAYQNYKVCDGGCAWYQPNFIFRCKRRCTRIFSDTRDSIYDQFKQTYDQTFASEDAACQGVSVTDPSSRTVLGFTEMCDEKQGGLVIQ